MLEILSLTTGIYLLLLITGYGVFTLLINDRKIKKYAIFVSPWFGVSIIALVSVWASMVGLSMNQAAWGILVLCGILSFYTLRKNQRLKINYTEHFLLAFFMILGLGFSLFPLLSRVGFATTISLSNLDPVSYSTVADYLKNETVFSDPSYVPFSPFTWSVGDLLHYSYRWGSPLLLSFFSVLFSLPAFKIYSVLINLLFTMSFSLVYVLTKYLFEKMTNLSIVVLFATYLINSTLLYMLYNVFFAQFVFSGIFIMSLLLFLVYVRRQKFKKWKIYPLDVSLGIMLSVTSSLYPEGLFLIILPMFAWIVIKVLESRSLACLKTSKIFLLGILLNPYTMFTAIRQLFKVVVSSFQATSIGWEMIRFANPMEMLGLYNLYYSKPLPVIIAAVVSFVLISMWLIGFMQVRQRLVILSYLLVFFMTYFITKVIGKNFFTYHRALTYTLFIYASLFTVFVDSLLKCFKSFKIKVLLVVLLVALSLRSAHRTLYQFYWHHEVIDRSLISLKDLNKSDVSQPFYTADVFMGEYHLWRRLWQEYFLSNQKIISRQNFTTDKNLVVEPLPVLAEKKNLEKNGVKLVYQDKIWENEYYILGYLDPEIYHD